MATKSQKASVVGRVFVDSLEILETTMRELEDLLNGQSTTKLYLDLEGENLSRTGTVSLLTMLVHNTRDGPLKLYLFDIHTLGQSAFDSAVPSTFIQQLATYETITLKQILESPVYQKVFFDVRNDSDALFSHFGVRLQNVMDVQLMENASRATPLVGPPNPKSKRFLNGLAKCIQNDTSMTPSKKRHFESVKDKGRRAFAPEKGGSYAVFNERPLNPDLKEYCEQDVLYLPNLYEVYVRRFKSSCWPWLRMIEEETRKRIADSQTAGYQPHGKQKAFAPKWVVE